MSLLCHGASDSTIRIGWDREPRRRLTFGVHWTVSMKFQRIEFSWRAAFIGLYMTPERDKVWVTIVPFLPLYFKRS